MNRYSRRNPPKLSKPKGKFLTSGCYCLSLRSGVLLLTIIQLLFTAWQLYLIFFFGGALFGVDVVFCVLFLVMGYMGWYGTLHYHLRKVKAYAVYLTLEWVVTTVLFFYSIPIINGVADDRCDSDDGCADRFLAQFYVINIVGVLFGLYYLLLVISWYVQLRSSVGGGEDYDDDY